MKNALNYITYGICGAAIMGASFIGYIVISGTPVQDLKGVGPLFAGNVQAEVEPEVTPEEITARDERAADSRGNRQVFADAGVALSAFSKTDSCINSVAWAPHSRNHLWLQLH